MADGADADDLALPGELDRPGRDEQVDEGAAPVAAAPLQRPGEADHPSAVGQPGHRNPAVAARARYAARAVIPGLPDRRGIAGAGGGILMILETVPVLPSNARPCARQSTGHYATLPRPCSHARLRNDLGDQATVGVSGQRPLPNFLPGMGVSARIPVA